MKILKLITLIILCLIVQNTACRANVVYDMGDYTTLDALTIHNTIYADDFALTTDSMINSIQFWMINSYNRDYWIRYYFFEDINGVPDSIYNPIATGLASNLTRRVINTEENLEQCSFKLETEVHLEAGKIYWIGLKAVDGGSISGSPFWSFTKWSESDSYFSTTDLIEENFFGAPPQYLQYVNDVPQWVEFQKEHPVSSLAFRLSSSFDGFETGTFSQLPWFSNDSRPWTISDNNPFFGVYSAESPVLNDSQQSSLEINMYSQGGRISFRFAIDSEKGDRLVFYIDEVEQDSWSGEINYTEAVYPVTAGMHSFKWQYIKDESNSAGADRAWLDFIIFPGMDDSDADGLADDWEIYYGLDPFVNNSGDDFDNDGLINLVEFRAATDPVVVTSQPVFNFGLDVDNDVDGLDLIKFITELDNEVFTSGDLEEFADNFGM